MAALAERGHPVERTVARIMVQVGTGQHHWRPQALDQDVLGWAPHTPPLAVAPAEPLAVPPASIAEMENPLSMRTATMLAAPRCPHEADMIGQLWPVDRIQVYMFRTDRHQASDPALAECDDPADSDAAVAAVNAR